MTYVAFNGNLPVGLANAAFITATPDLPWVSFAVKNTGVTAQILSWIDWEGNQVDKTLANGEPQLFRNQHIKQVWVDGGTVFAFIQYEPSWADPRLFEAQVTNTVNTVVTSQTAGLALDATLTAGNVVARTRGATMANGGVAPYDGVAEVTAFVTDATGVTVSDGTITKGLAVPGTNAVTTVASVAVTYRFNVKNGVTYTLAGTGLTLLGPGITVN